MLSVLLLGTGGVAVLVVLSLLLDMAALRDAALVLALLAAVPATALTRREKSPTWFGEMCSGHAVMHRSHITHSMNRSPASLKRPLAASSTPRSTWMPFGQETSQPPQWRQW